MTNSRRGARYGSPSSRANAPTRSRSCGRRARLPACSSSPAGKVSSSAPAWPTVPRPWAGVRGAARGPRAPPTGRGYGVLHALADHCVALGLPELRSSVEDEGSLAFAHGSASPRSTGRSSSCGRSPKNPIPDRRPTASTSCCSVTGPSCGRRATRASAGRCSPTSPPSTSRRQRRAVEQLLVRRPDVLGPQEGAVVGCAGLHLDTDRPGACRELPDGRTPQLARPRRWLGTSSGEPSTGPRPTTCARSTPGPRPATFR